MRALLSRTLLAASAALSCALVLAGCQDSLALKDVIEEKVEYAATTYAMTLSYGSSDGGTVNF